MNPADTLTPAPFPHLGSRLRRAGALAALAMLLMAAVAAAAEPTVGCNGWSNREGVQEGTLTVRPVDTTSPKPPLGYVEYLPKGYDASNSAAKWPLIVFISGAGEIGDGTDTAANGHQLYNNMVRNGPLHQVVAAHWDFPAVVVAVQQPGLWNNAGILSSVFSYMQANYRLDPRRLYLTGLCDGAVGVLNFSSQHDGLLAGIMPIEGGSAPAAGAGANMVDLPMWAVHCFADPIIARTSTISWVDQATQAEFGSSDVMSTYPGYAGKPYHAAVDVDSSTGYPAQPAGPTTFVPACTVTNGSTWVAFPSSVTFGSATFNTWGGTDAQPYAETFIGGGGSATAAAGVVSIGKPNGLYLGHAYTGPSGTRDLLIQIPIGYNCSAYYDASTHRWTWERTQDWDQSRPGKRIFTMCWYQDHTRGWVDQYSNGTCWDWLLSQSKPAAPVITVQPRGEQVQPGEMATFTVAVTASPTPTYQWSRNGTAISGATAASCSVGPVSAADNGASFTVAVANSLGGQSSSAAALTVVAACASEPQLVVNDWSNLAGVVEGAVSVRPVDTTQPAPPYGFLEYLPRGYDPGNPAKLWPLVVYLPNTSEAGDGTDTAANGHQLTTKLEKYGPFAQIVNQNWDFPAIIIAPQVTTNWAKAANIKAVVEYAKAVYRVDVNRIVVTGNLEGASGALRYAVAYPADPAGALLIESTIATSQAQAAALKGLPMWLAHSFADPAVGRGISIGWNDALAVAANGGTSDAMATYPGYGGDRNHYAVDSDATTHRPLNANGGTTVIPGCSLAASSASVTFPAGTSFGSTVFGMWGGSAALPFATVTVSGDPATYVSVRGYPTSLTLSAPSASAVANATVTVHTPVGYNATAYRNADGSWGWNRDQVWDQGHADDLLLTLFWYQDPTQGWTGTWGNVQAWDWLLNQVRPPSGNG
jgi:predicted peptidase